MILITVLILLSYIACIIVSSSYIFYNILIIYFLNLLDVFTKHKKKIYKIHIKLNLIILLFI